MSLVPSAYTGGHTEYAVADRHNRHSLHVFQIWGLAADLIFADKLSTYAVVVVGTTDNVASVLDTQASFVDVEQLQHSQITVTSITQHAVAEVR